MILKLKVWGNGLSEENSQGNAHIRTNVGTLFTRSPGGHPVSYSLVLEMLTWPLLGFALSNTKYNG